MLAKAFRRSLTEDCHVAPGSHVLAAVSGGADSTALLCLLCEAAEPLRLRVSCAHLDHGLRGERAREDLEFVRTLCARLGVPFYEGRADTPALAAQRGGGVEDAARALRRAFLLDTAREVHADAIALAHHARDQAETVLLHAARGSDLRGLCAMQSRSGPFVRPLLDVEPEALRAYLQEIGQPWREDETNADARFARNRVRLLVLPELERACPGAGRALCRLAKAARRDEDYFSEALSALPPVKTRRLVNGAACEAEPLRALHPALVGRFLARWLAKHGAPGADAEAIGRLSRALIAGEETAAMLPGGLCARVGRRWLCLTRKGEKAQDAPILPEGVSDTPFGRFAVRPARPGETGDGVLAQAMPLSRMPGLCVGGRRPGERMTPLGGAGSAPIKKLLIDAGVERAMRDSVPVVRAADGSVLWLVGLRPAEGCRVRAGEPAALLTYLGLEPPDAP